MTAIFGTLTNSTPSPDFTPTNSISDLVINNISHGLFRIEAKAPNMTEYLPVFSSAGDKSRTLVKSMSTTDPAIVYRIRSLVSPCNIEFYIGA